MKQAKGTQRVPNRGSWKPGQSGNPHGRPRTGLALAEAIRERIDPHKVIDLLESHLADDKVPAAQRLAAALPWMHAGFMKPPTSVDVTTTNTAPAYDLSALTDAELAELEARLAGGAERNSRLLEPSVPDEKQPTLNRFPTTTDDQ